MHNIDELIEIISATLTLDEVMDVLGLSLPELLYLIKDTVSQNEQEFLKVV